MNIKRLLKMEPAPETEVPADFQEKLEQSQALERAIREFFKTPVGKYLKQELDQDKKQAMLELTKIPAWDIQHIREAQDKYQLALRIEQYFAKALIQGNQATQIIEGNINYG